MAKLKKDGTPKAAGGSRGGGGRPSKNRTKTNIYLDNDLVQPFGELPSDDKNKLIRKGLSM